METIKRRGGNCKSDKDFNQQNFQAALIPSGPTSSKDLKGDSFVQRWRFEGRLIWLLENLRLLIKCQFEKRRKWKERYIIWRQGNRWNFYPTIQTLVILLGRASNYSHRWLRCSVDQLHWQALSVESFQHVKVVLQEIDLISKMLLAQIDRHGHRSYNLWWIPLQSLKIHDRQKISGILFWFHWRGGQDKTQGVCFQLSGGKKQVNIRNTTSISEGLVQRLCNL